MGDIFLQFFNTGNYKLENATDKQVLLYKEAFKVFKEKNPESKATIKLDINSNLIEMYNFDGLSMYKFGYEVAKIEEK